MRYLTYQGQLISAVNHRLKALPRAIIKRAELCVMCTLHMELRIGESCLTELVREIMHYDSASKRNQMLENVSKWFARTFSGSGHDMVDVEEDDPHQFNVVLDPKGKDVAHIKMSGARQKKVMKNIEELIHIVMSEELMQQRGIKHTVEEYSILFQKYKQVVSVIQKVEDLTDQNDRINAVQDILDEFCFCFHELFGSSKITNYIHTLWSGHCR